MKHVDTTKVKRFFAPLIQSASMQAAVMVLKPGQRSSDQVENEHPKSEQWLFVVSGTGKAKAGKRSLKLKTGTLLLIEKSERHQIINSGSAPLVTINFYSPPAYTKDGDARPTISRR